MQRNVRLLLSYDGTHFHGWQNQPGLRTVQGELESALRTVLRHPLNVIASGRTDAGVHASGQVANVRTDSTIPADRLAHAITSRLPEDVAVLQADDVADAFHATRSATSKLYCYRIHNAESRPIFGRSYVHHIWKKLDLDRIQEGAAKFVGTFDFSAFATAGCVRETMVRTILQCSADQFRDEIHIRVEGTGFLHNQVRIMVGTLLEISKGRMEPDDIAKIIESKDRTTAGPTAAAKGLCLEWVKYPPELLVPDASVPNESGSSETENDDRTTNP